MEARIAQQQANFDHLHQQNILILSNLRLRPDMNGEEARAERTKRITEALQLTTFTVAEKDILEKADDRDIEEQKSSIKVDEELGAILDHETMDYSALTLPPDGRNASRTVPGGCAICLCPYEPGDQVAWSGEEHCKHAFHRECIIPWLAKKEEPKCPCCRQDFCIVEPITAADLTPITPFGLIPSSQIGQSRMHILTEEGIVPTPDLVASQLVTETGMISLREQQARSTNGNEESSEDQIIEIPVVPLVGNMTSQEQSQTDDNEQEGNNDVVSLADDSDPAPASQQEPTSLDSV